MKYTGWVVLVIGVLIGTYGLFTLMPTDPHPAAVGTADAPGANPFPIAYALLPFAALAVAVGALMVAYGGSGVIRIRSLWVRR